MSKDDKDKRTIELTIREGVIILRDSEEPIFVFPSGSIEAHVDVVMQLEYFRYCVRRIDYVNDFLESLQEEDDSQTAITKQKEKETRRKIFKIIK